MENYVHSHNILTENIFQHILNHTLQDTLSLIPFMFIVFLVLEYMEHSMTNKSLALIEKAGKGGPLLGGIVGALPQCGFSVMATNLFAGRIITIGTIVAVYLSTSDEMLAVMLSSNTSIFKIAKIILLKTCIGIAAGFAVDFAHRARLRYQQNHTHTHHSHHHHHHEENTDSHDHPYHEYINDFCVEEECCCSHEKPFIAAFKHTVKIYIVIFIVTFLLTLVIGFAGLDVLEQAVSRAGIWAPIVSCVVGMIPNCASSVAITQLYLSGAISFGTAMSGLLCGSGIAWIVLFRVNPHSRQNFKIMGIVFLVGAVSGIILNFLGVAI